MQRKSIFDELINDLKEQALSLDQLRDSLNEILKPPIDEFKKRLDKTFSRPQRTLTIIKPDAVKKGLIGEIIKRFENKNIKPVAMKMIKINKLQAKFFYGHLKKKIPKKVFDSIVDYMTSKRVVLIVWQGRGVIRKVREMCGPTDPMKARKTQIRSLSEDDMQKEFRKGKAVKNIIHSSETAADAKKEIGFFFMPWEIIDA